MEASVPFFASVVAGAREQYGPNYELRPEFRAVDELARHAGLNKGVDTLLMVRYCVCVFVPRL